MVSNTNIQLCFLMLLYCYCDCKASITCGKNEKLYSCAPCEQTCSNMNPVCTKDCKPEACGCISGYVRHDAECIPAESCKNPALCDATEEYKTCGSCEPTCYTPDPMVCTAVCRPSACFCKGGYVRQNRVCILKKHCELAKQCGDNEQLYSCGACNGTCFNPNPLCTEQCRPPSCGCMKGYVREDDKCIKQSQCTSGKASLHAIQQIILLTAFIIAFQK